MKRNSGFTLIEILASLTLFSLAMVGLYFSMNGVKQAMATSLKRDVETVYADMLIAGVNPYDINVETAYDITTKTNVCTHLGLTPCPAEITGAFFTRLVDSDPQTADVRRVNVYFYRKQSDTTPYRYHRKNLSLPVMAYNLAASGTTVPTCTDNSGQKWINLRSGGVDRKNTTSGSVKAGNEWAFIGDPVADFQADGVNSGNVNGSIDNSLMTGDCRKHFAWRNVHQANTLVYMLPASKDQVYRITLGFNEFKPSQVSTSCPGASARCMDIYIHGKLMGSVDPYAEAGYYTALTKTYTATPVMDASGIYRFWVNIGQTGGQSSSVSWIKLEKML
jgi:prepilin-type N-terminal cleavage/methylation domain-containing protein